MFKRSPKVEEYTSNQTIVKEIGIHKLICTTFYYGNKRVSWLYHIVTSSLVGGSPEVYGTYDEIGEAMSTFDHMINYIDCNNPGDVISTHPK